MAGQARPTKPVGLAMPKKHDFEIEWEAIVKLLKDADDYDVSLGYLLQKLKETGSLDGLIDNNDPSPDNEGVNAANESGSGWTGITEYRSIDGTGNNLTHTEYGSTHQQFLRMADSDYGDGLNTPAGADRPSPREISNALYAQDGALPDESGHSDMLWLWGQFIDHDIDLTPEGHEFFPISVPTGDPYFDPMGTGTQMIPMMRSDYDPSTGITTPREQMNAITAFLDGSVVYGSDPMRQAFLRDADGKLKTSDGDLLPFNDGTIDNAMGMSTHFFVAGDVRANEQTGLTSMHTIFVREHNRLVDELASEHPELTGDELYEKAKVMVEAMLQSITYNDFLPILIGPDALGAYSGYDSTIDPGIANIFATAAYRFGHTMVSTLVERSNEDGTEFHLGDLALRDAFFNPSLLLEEGALDATMRGFAEGEAESLNITMIDELRNFLFGEPGMGGLDLAALNIQRGRDHGLPDYNTARMEYGLDPLTSFDEITSDKKLAKALSDVYDGDINNIDAFVGGLIEDPADGALMGELFQTIIGDQFARIRDADRFWYEERFDDATIEWIESNTLSDVITRNSDIDFLQKNVFLSYIREGGTDEDDMLNGTHDRDLLIGFDGDDTLHGHHGDDELFGGEGDDNMFGGVGDDRLTGGTGNDLMRGGKGKDAFIIEIDSGQDTIKHYQPGVDHIDLSVLNLTLEALENQLSQVGQHVVLDLSDGNSLTLKHTDLDDLSLENDFWL
jgi:peroxidase